MTQKTRLQSRRLRRLLCATAMMALPITATAANLEITHWWTSGGEAAAVKELAAAFEAGTPHKWVDGAIAGSGSLARPIIISRILGGDPMGATQLNHGQQAQELIEAGLMLDLTDIAEEGHWADVVRPASLLEACTFEGKVYCVPLNIHSTQWLWTSNAAFEKAGIPPVTNWEELKAAAPKLREAGIQPLISGAQDWQYDYIVQTLITGLGGKDLFYGAYRDGNEDILRGDAMRRVFEELVEARGLLAGASVQDWNLATAAVINGTAASQVMGDWAQGEFQLAGQTAGTDYDCLMGLGGEPLISTGGDAFYFPLNKDPEISVAQKDLAKMLISPEVQVVFNSKKGSLPVRGDVDLGSAGLCMQKGLKALAEGKNISSIDMLITPDAVGQIRDMLKEFFASDMDAASAQDAFAEVILSDK